MGRQEGVLREGWTASLDDYAIVCDWALDGNVLVVGDVMGNIRAYHGKSGRTLWQQKNIHEGGLLAMSVHPAGTVFATAGQDGRVIIWNVQNGEIAARKEIGSDWVEHLAWSSEGEWLAAACSRHVFTLDRDCHEKWQSEQHPSTVSALAWSDNNELATASYGRVAFFDMTTEKLREKLEWKGSLVSMVLSPDRDIVACGSQDNSVHFWRRSTGHDSMMSGYPSKPIYLAFDSTGTVLATSGSDIVTVWSFQDAGPEGTRPGELELHGKTISSLAFAPKGMRLASGAKDGSVPIWALENDGQGSLVGVALIEDAVSNLVWRPDGRGLAATSASGGITAWRVNS